MALEDAQERMAKAVEHAQADFATVRTGRATPGLVENLMVDFYGSQPPCASSPGSASPRRRLLVISPYDKGRWAAIEKAIQASDLGITPSNDGNVIRLAFPAAHRGAAQGAGQGGPPQGRGGPRGGAQPPARRSDTSSRHWRRTASCRQDELERVEKELDKLTHEQVAAIDKLLAHKEQELLEV